MKVKVKKLHVDAVIPKYQTKGSSGFDFHALEHMLIQPGCTELVKTGLAISVPEGYEIQIRPRSGVSLRTSLRVANAPGTIDSDFLGEICLIMHNTNIEEYGHVRIMQGDRIAQGVICPIAQGEFEEVEELGKTERGTNGFGSTGK